jgi:hypothetical protein
MNIRIKPNKKRFPFGLVVGLLASIVLYFAIKKVDPGVPWYYYTPAYIMLFIYAAIFTLLALANYLKSLLDNDAKLTISEIGVLDNLSIHSVGQIPWTDISGAYIRQLFNVDFLIVQVHNPEKYLLDKNIIKRYLLKKSLKRWKSPLVISAKGIEYDLQELKTIILANSNKS